MACRRSESWHPHQGRLSQLTVSIPTSPRSLSLPSSSPKAKLQGNMADIASAGSSPSPSPKSPSSWEQSFKELSQSLQQICGSPTREVPLANFPQQQECTKQAVQRSSSYSGYPTSASPLSESPPCQILSGRPTTGSPPCQILSGTTSCHLLQPTMTPCSPSPSSSTSSFTMPVPITKGNPRMLNPDVRPLVVRHETSEMSLRRKLEALWRGGYGADTALDMIPISDNVTVGERAARRESLPCGYFKVTVNVASVLYDDLCVAIMMNNYNLHIHNVRTGQTLLESRLPMGLELERLDCYIHQGLLVVRERSCRVLQVGEVSSAHRVYLPIMIEDDTSALMRVIQHIPSRLTHVNIRVKTLDDRLVIKTRNLESPIKEAPTSECTHAVDTATENNVFQPASFARELRLPCRVDPRSVVAMLTRYNQLIVNGALSMREKSPRRSQLK